MAIDWRDLETFIADEMRDSREEPWRARIEKLSKKLADKLNGHQNDRASQGSGRAPQGRSASHEDAHQHAGGNAVVHRARRAGVGGDR